MWAPVRRPNRARGISFAVAPECWLSGTPSDRTPSLILFILSCTSKDWWLVVPRVKRIVSAHDHTVLTLRKVRADFVNATTAFIASPHTNSPPCGALVSTRRLAGTAKDKLKMRPRASSSAFSACVMISPVDPESLVCVSAVYMYCSWVACLRVRPAPLSLHSDATRGVSSCLSWSLACGMGVCAKKKV